MTLPLHGPERARPSQKFGCVGQDALKRGLGLFS